MNDNEILKEYRKCKQFFENHENINAENSCKLLLSEINLEFNYKLMVTALLLQIEDVLHKEDDILVISTSIINQINPNSIEKDDLEFIFFILLIRVDALLNKKEFQSAIVDCSMIINFYERYEIFNKFYLSTAHMKVGQVKSILAQNNFLNSSEILELLKEAIKNFEKAISEDPDFLPAYIYIGLAYAESGQDDKSIKSYQKAVLIQKKKHVNNIPSRTLYKFREVNNTLIKSLKKNTIYFNNPTRFNDPFDCLLYRFPHYNKSKPFKQVMDKIKLFCLSDTNDSILLWSHYANSHKGIAIGYKITEDYLSRNELIIEKVEYEENAVVLPEKFTDLINSNFFRKLNSWSYEKEYRVFSFNQPNPFYEAPEISEVIFGLNCTKNDIQKVKKALKKYSSIQFFQVFDDKEYLWKLLIKEI
jgi:tetratricopeptide (TPR) repeat protein